MRNLHGLLERASVLVVCLPGTKATEGLIGMEELRKLPRGAVVVNVGRGSVVDERALYECLRDGHLGAAAIDVWWNYPQHREVGGTASASAGKGGGRSGSGSGGSGSGGSGEGELNNGVTTGVNNGPSTEPFHELGNVVMSPHRGQCSDTKAEDRVNEIVFMLGRMAETGELPNRFFLERGY